MKPGRTTASFLAGLLASLLASTASRALTLSASLTINAGTTVTSFVPLHIFGANQENSISKTNSTAVQAQVQAGGIYFLRFPGGKVSDDYHWNGTGATNASGYWEPSGTSYSAGYQGCMVYRGTSSPAYGNPSNIDDGNTATTWRSNVDTDSPNHQWAYMDLGATNTAVNSVTIVWGTPYAASFQIQYDNANAAPYKAASEACWTNTSAGTVSGTGGTQGVTFNTVSTRYLRLLMTASSGPVTADLGPATLVGPAYAVAELTVYDNSIQISVNADTQASQSPMVVSSTDPSSSTTCTSASPSTPNTPSYFQPTFDFDSFMAYAGSFSPKAVPLITVNLGTGTPQEAASWVYYANVVKGYGIKYWEVGNEADILSETGGPFNAGDYGRRFIEYASAMKAVDPTLTVLGPDVNDPLCLSNAYDGNDFIQDFLLRLYNNAGGNAVSFLGGIDFHNYTNVSGFPAGFAAPASTLSTLPVTLAAWEGAVGASTNLPVIVSEYNAGNPAPPPHFTVLLDNALYVADWLGTFISAFGANGYSNYWAILQGGTNADSSPTGGDPGLFDLSTYQQRPSYRVFQMMAADWAIPGDSSAHQLVSTGSSSATLLSYADYRPDGKLSLAVINTDNADSYAATLNLNGYSATATAVQWTFNSSNYAWQTTTLPYSASPDTAPTSAVLSGVCPSFPVTFSPYSITVIQFNHPCTPTFTPTKTATSTPSGTPTNTDTPTSTSTPTSSPTLTPTGTPSDTATVTPTFTPTSTPTVTATLTLTSTPTDTATVTASYTPTSSPTVTPTSSPTGTATDTATSTTTLTPTGTPTPTPTSTGTGTFTSTSTCTPTRTRTFTFTPTATRTATSTPTSTFTRTPTSTPTITATPTVTSTPLPATSLVLSANLMGPASPPLVLSYEVAQAGDIRINIYNVAAGLIRHLADTYQAPGSYSMAYDGRDDNRSPLASGLYFVEVVQPGKEEIRKFLVVR